MTHIYVGKLTIIGSDNGLSPGRRQANISTNAGILFIRPLGTNFNEILIEIHIFSFKKIPFENVVWKMASILSRPQCVNRMCLKYDSKEGMKIILASSLCLHILQIHLNTVSSKAPCGVACKISSGESHCKLHVNSAHKHQSYISCKWSSTVVWGPGIAPRPQARDPDVSKQQLTFRLVRGYFLWMFKTTFVLFVSIKIPSHFFPLLRRWCIHDLTQGCGNSIANALELPQSCLIIRLCIVSNKIIFLTCYLINISYRAKE